MLWQWSRLLSVLMPSTTEPAAPRSELTRRPPPCSQRACPLPRPSLALGPLFLCPERLPVFTAAATPTMRGGGVGDIARRGVITIPVDNGDAERAYRRLRKIMVSEGIYKELRESTTGHRKPAELRVLARKERERRTRRSKLNSKLGWIMRQKERGF